MNESDIQKVLNYTKSIRNKSIDALTEDLRNEIPELTKEEARRICQNVVNENTKQLL